MNAMVVISLCFALLLAVAALCREVRGIFIRAVLALYRRRALAQGIGDPRSGAVLVIQRGDSALRLNPHFHSLVLDGVFECSPGREGWISLN